MRRPVIAIAIAIAIAVLGGSVVGCTHAPSAPSAGAATTMAVSVDQQPAPVWSDTGDGSCRKWQAPPTPPQRRGHFEVTPLAEVRAPTSMRPTMPWDHYLPYVADSKRISVCDLESGMTATVAAVPAGDPGVLDVPMGSGDIVVYLRAARKVSVDNPETDWSGWRVEARDLRTGRHWVLDRNRSDTRSPETDYGNLSLSVPTLDGPWATWLHFDRKRKEAELWSFDFRSGRRRALATVPQGGRAGLGDGVVVYDRITSKDYSQRDLYSVPADGSRPPRRLLAMKGGQWPRIGGGRAVWDVGKPGDHETGRVSWMYPLTGKAAPVRLGPGSWPQPATGFVLAKVDQEFRLYDPAHPGEPAVALVPPGEKHEVDMAGAWRDLVVWAVPEGRFGTVTVIHVARVSAVPGGCVLPGTPPQEVARDDRAPTPTGPPVC